jgi:hypothetical protein
MPFGLLAILFMPFGLLAILFIPFVGASKQRA